MQCGEQNGEGRGFMGAYTCYISNEACCPGTNMSLSTRTYHSTPLPLYRTFGTVCKWSSSFVQGDFEWFTCIRAWVRSWVGLGHEFAGKSSEILVSQKITDTLSLADFCHFQIQCNWFSARFLLTYFSNSPREIYLTLCLGNYFNLPVDWRSLTRLLSMTFAIAGIALPIGSDIFWINHSFLYVKFSQQFHYARQNFHFN